MNDENKKEVVGPLTEVLADTLEVILDGNLSEGVLKDIPFLGSVLKLFNAGMSIRDRLFFKKLVKFIENIDSTTEEQRNKFWSKFDQDEGAKRKLGEQLIVYIEQFDDSYKSVLLARAFNALQKGLINYKSMLDLGILITSLKTHYLDKIAEIIYRLSDTTFNDIHETEDELPLIYFMEKDGLLMIQSVIKMKHVRHEEERKPMVESTYKATLAINLIDHVIYDIYEALEKEILDMGLTRKPFILKGHKRKEFEQKWERFKQQSDDQGNS